jgi:hypothetical protein
MRWQQGQLDNNDAMTMGGQRHAAPPIQVNNQFMLLTV